MFWVTLIFSVFNSLIKILDNNCSNSVAGATYSIFVSIFKYSKLKGKNMKESFGKNYLKKL